MDNIGSSCFSCTMVDALRLCCNSSFVLDGRPNGIVKVKAYRELIYMQMGFFSVFFLYIVQSVV